MVTPYWKWDAVIAEPLLQQVENEMTALNFTAGSLHGDHLNPNVRKSSVAAFPGWHWFSGVLYNYAVHANELANWRRTLVKPEATQIASYKSGEYYDWHPDINPLSDAPLERKLTIVCLLSKRTEFNGGALELRGAAETPVLERGSVIVFPSIIEHQVASITRGTRISATCWALGPNAW